MGQLSANNRDWKILGSSSTRVVLIVSTHYTLHSTYCYCVGCASLFECAVQDCACLSLRLVLSPTSMFSIHRPGMNAPRAGVCAGVELRYQSAVSAWGLKQRGAAGEARTEIWGQAEKTHAGCHPRAEKAGPGFLSMALQE